MATEHNHELPPVKIAFILDNEVVDILHTDERLAAIFLSGPRIMDVTEFTPPVGAIYDPETNLFTAEFLKDSEMVRDPEHPDAQSDAERQAAAEAAAQNR